MHGLPVGSSNDETSPRCVNDPLTNALLKTLLAASRDGVLAFDSRYRLLVVNRQALHYLHLPGNPEDWYDCELADLAAELRVYAPEAVNPLRLELERYRKGDDSRGEGLFRTGYATIHWLTLPLDLSSSVSQQSTSPGRVVILSDVTSRNASDLQCQDLIRRLLGGLQKPLCQIKEAMNCVVTGGKESLPEGSQQVLLAALGEADSTLATVRQLAEFSLLQAGQTSLSMSAFPFTDVVERVLELELPVAQKKALDLEHRSAVGLPLTWGDRTLIERMFANLISGILDAASPGGTLHIEVEMVPAGDARILVSITHRPTAASDRIPEAVAGRVREPSPPYEQALMVRDLNLAFCRKVVEAHGERFSVTPSQSDDLVVSFTLPQVSESLVSVGIPLV